MTVLGTRDSTMRKKTTSRKANQCHLRFPGRGFGLLLMGIPQGLGLRGTVQKSPSARIIPGDERAL